MIKRVIFYLFIAELIYVAVFNAGLNIDFTQKMINKMKPEKFQVTWQKAWTPYPFKIYIEDAAAWGASSSQKWKVEVASASASVSLLPLLKHHVRVYDVTAADVKYFQRPVKAEGKKAENESYFAPQQYFESTLSPEVVSKVQKKQQKKKESKRKKEKKAWKIALENIVAKGKHAFWLYQAKGDFNGIVTIDTLNIETKSGPFSVENAKIDIVMDALEIGKKRDVLTQSKIKGTVGFDPIVFSENKGAKILTFLSFDIDIASQMGNMDVLNVYLHRFKNAKLDGTGKLAGHINFQRGTLLAGTDLKISADTLLLEIMRYKVKGNAEIALNVKKNKAEVLQGKINFDSLQAYAADKKNEEDLLLFIGKGLVLNAEGSSRLMPLPAKKEMLTFLKVDIPTVSVDDISVFQDYVPEKWAFTLQEGSGELKAAMSYKKRHLAFDVNLLSKEAKVALAKKTFKTDLDLFVRFEASLGKKFEANMSGSYLSLKNSVLIDEKAKHTKSSQAWDTHLNIIESTFALPLDENNISNAEVLKSLDKADIKKLLSRSDATLKVEGLISQFEWLNLIMKNSLNLHFKGRGELNADLKLKQGLLAEGSTINVVPKDLNIALLDYVFTGEGLFHFLVTKGGSNPSMKFDLALHDAKMKRQDEKAAMIEQVKMHLQGEINELDLESSQKALALHLQIPSAKVKNIAVYNSYIPKNSPFKLTSGTADMHADIVLGTNNAKGYVKLNTHGLTMNIDDQKISARLNMDIKIASGVPKDMAFNIAASKIVLDQARVAGSTVQYKQPDWSAVVHLNKADVVWRKPIRLHSETSLHIKDSRPVIAMMDNKKGKHNWLSNLATIENIHGKATVNMANNVITFPYAMVKSDKIDIGAKGIISPNLRDGVFYLRFKGLKILLKMRNGKKNLDIFHVQKTFDNYIVPKP